MKNSCSVLIPALNAAGHIAKCLDSVRSAGPGIEIIIMDGGSSDRTVDIAENYGAKIIRTAPGRGAQCRLGAELASGDILFFLHADSQLEKEVFSGIDRVFQNPQVRIAKLSLRFDHQSRLLNFYACCARWDSLLTSFGDQGILIRKDFYAELGGFPPWPLFEDVHLLRLARKKSKIRTIPSRITTSAEKFRKHGMIRQQLRNAFLILRYLLGTDPQELSLQYNRAVSHNLLR